MEICSVQLPCILDQDNRQAILILLFSQQCSYLKQHVFYRYSYENDYLRYRNVNTFHLRNAFR